MSLVSVVAAGALMLAPTGASATHVQCGDTITQDTTLDSDLTCTGTGAGAGVIIGARGVTLNLNNHTIAGDETGTGVLITASAATLQGGGLVRDFGVGVELNSVRRSAVRSVDVPSNVRGIAMVAANGNEIFGNVLSGNTSRGINLGSDSNRNRITDNLVFGTTGVTNPLGITVLGFSDGNDLVNNDVDETGGTFGHGIFVQQESKRTLVELNTSNNNTGHGILISEPATTITSNAAHQNDGWGIIAVPGVRDGGGNTATGNTLGQCQNVSC